MTAEKALSSRPGQGQQASLPLRPHAPASHMEVCDALLAFCDRATSITKTIGGSLRSHPIDLTPYVNNLTRMRGGTSSGVGIKPAALANDLSELVTIQLGSHLSTPDAQYWIAITTAFAAAVRTALPELSESVSDTQSDIIQQHAQSTIPYKERYD